MSCMFLTLDVSKLSGWLNAYAACRESKGGHMMGSEMRARRREAAGATACKQRAGEGSTVEWEQGPGRSARRTCCTCL